MSIVNYSKVFKREIGHHSPLLQDKTETCALLLSAPSRNPNHFPSYLAFPTPTPCQSTYIFTDGTCAIFILPICLCTYRYLCLELCFSSSFPLTLKCFNTLQTSFQGNLVKSSPSYHLLSLIQQTHYLVSTSNGIFIYLHIIVAYIV